MFSNYLYKTHRFRCRNKNSKTKIINMHITFSQNILEIKLFVVINKCQVFCGSINFEVQ